MAKITQEKKYEALKEWLTANNLKYVENHESQYGVTIDLKVLDLNIAVWISNGDREWEQARFAATVDHKHWLHQHYAPFFIRPTETKAFTLEKIANCCRDRMIWLQKKYMREMDRQSKDGDKSNSAIKK